MNPVLDFPKIEMPVPTLVAPASIRQTVLAQFHATEPGLVALAAKYHRVAFDTATPKGLIAAKAARLDLRDNGRFLIERAEKRIKGEVNDLKRDMADEVARLVAIVQPVEDQVDMQIKAREAVLAAEKAERERIEAERIAAHEAVIAGIRAYPGKARGATAEKIAAGIAFVESQVYGPELEEYQARAATAQAEAIDTLCDMHAAALKAEQDAADREAQRAENARVAAELAAERKRLADEAAAVKAQALALQRKLDAQAKKEIDELDAQRAESDRLVALAAARRRAEANAMAADAVGIVAAPGQYPAPLKVVAVLDDADTPQKRLNRMVATPFGAALAAPTPVLSDTAPQVPTPAVTHADFVALVMTAFDGKFKVQPKMDIDWWARVREAGQALSNCPSGA